MNILYLTEIKYQLSNLVLNINMLDGYVITQSDLSGLHRRLQFRTKMMPIETKTFDSLSI